MEENKLVCVMIRGRPKLLRGTQIEKFKDNYAESNLSFVKNRWQQPVRIKKTTNKPHKKSIALTEESVKETSSEDEDC